jgi:hypothetical protein
MAAMEANQIAFTARLAEIDARIAETNRINAEIFARIEQRFNGIEAILMEHTQILRGHQRMLEALPEAVRRRFGFTPPGGEE